MFSLALLGVVHFEPRPYYLPPSPAIETPFIFVRAGLCFAGIVKAVPLIRGLSWPQRALWFVGFAVFELAFDLPTSYYFSEPFPLM